MYACVSALNLIIEERGSIASLIVQIEDLNVHGD